MRSGRLAPVAIALSLLLLFVFLALFALPAYAHGTVADADDAEADEHGGVDKGTAVQFGERPNAQSGASRFVPLLLDEAMRQGSMRAVFAGAAVLAVLVAASVLAKRKGKKAMPLLSHLLFWSIVVVVVAVTAYVAGSTIYLNAVSKTAGPVHWHADFEAWRCGQQLELVDPEGLSNRVGSSVLHEHGDNRMHIEGVVVDFSDVSVGSFFRSVGGDLHQGVFSLPTDSGIATMRDGDSCPGEAGVPGKLQVFVYKTIGGKMVQEKLGSSSYESYVPSPFSNVPPGDCIIFEFAPEIKDKTGRMCGSYEAALKSGALNGG